MNNQPRRKGFSFLSFFLGFLIGIIFLVGAVAGVVIYALNGKIDNVLEMAGLDNSKDENGKNQIINTDIESGGAETFMQLITKVTKMAGDTQNLSVSEVENLIPAVGGMVDSVHQTLSEYIAIDRAELVSVKFSEFGQYVTDKVLDIEPAALMEKFEMGELLDNKIMSMLLVGVEAKYVEVGSAKYPVYYDVYNLENETYKRANDGAALPAKYNGLVYEKNGKYRINYYISGDVAYVTDEDCTAVAARAVGDVYSPYTPEYATLSGNFYYKNDEKIVETPVTLRTLSDGGLETLDDVYLTEFITEGDGLADKLLGDISIGDVMNGRVDVDSMIDKVTVTEFVDIEADSPIMVYVAYGIYGLNKETSHGTVDIEGVPTECILTVENGIVKSVATVGGVAVESANLQGISNNINTVTDKLTLGDIIDPGDNKILKSLAGTTIAGMPEAINGLTLDKVMDISDDDKILSQIKDATIETLPAKIGGITVNAMFADEIYAIKDKNGNVVTPAERKLATKYNAEYLYYTKNEKKNPEDKDSYSLVDEGNGLGKLTGTQFNAGEYYTYGKAQGEWKILLYAKDGGDSSEKAYTMNNMSEMITNVAVNMQNSTLRELDEAGILKFEDSKSLDKCIPYLDENKKPQKSEPIGDMKLMDLINLIVNFIAQVS